MRELAILTINDHCNIGNRLQNYATQDDIQEVQYRSRDNIKPKGIVEKG